MYVIRKYDSIYVMKTLAEDLPTTHPVVFMDFDDVLNIFSSNSHYKRNHKTLPGYRRKTSVYVEEAGVGLSFTLKWSAELVRKLMSLKTEHPYTWVWLTTWMNHTDKLNSTLQLTTDYTAEWDAYPKRVGGWAWGGASGLSNEQLHAHRNKAKLDYVLDYIEANPGAPFVWVDDSATQLWDEKYLTVETPHLIITPTELDCFTLQHLDELTEFLVNLKK